MVSDSVCAADVAAGAAGVRVAVCASGERREYRVRRLAYLFAVPML